MKNLKIDPHILTSATTSIVEVSHCFVMHLNVLTRYRVTLPYEVVSTLGTVDRHGCMSDGLIVEFLK